MSHEVSAAAAPPYEATLAHDPQWAVGEAGRHFEQKSAVFLALHKIAVHLAELQIPYAVTGDLALFQHGLRRFAEEINLLVGRECLKRIHEVLLARGYAPPQPQSKHLRDSALGVRIEFATTGDYPGDGRPTPVTYPDPGTASVAVHGIRYIKLKELLALKLASGMANAGCLKDLADVQELLKRVELPLGFAAHLPPHVQEKYVELWQQVRKRYVRRWRTPSVPSSGTDITGLLTAVAQSAELLREMQSDGVQLESSNEDGGKDILLVTTNPEVARKYGMVDAADFWDESLPDSGSGARVEKA